MFNELTVLWSIDQLKMNNRQIRIKKDAVYVAIKNVLASYFHVASVGTYVIYLKHAKFLLALLLVFIDVNEISLIYNQNENCF